MRLTLAQRIGWATTALAIAVSGVIGLIAFITVRARLESEIEIVLRSQAALVAQRAEIALTQIAHETAGLAQNPLFVNALVDSSGREAYLEPFLRDLDLSSTVPVRLSLHDFMGRPLTWSGGAATGVHYTGASWVAQVMQGQSIAVVTAEETADELRFTIAVPVIFPASGQPEGMLVAAMDLTRMLMPPMDDIGLSPSVVLRTSSGAVLAGAGHQHPPDEEMFLVSRPLVLPPLFADLGLTIIAGESRSHADEPLNALLVRFIVFGFALSVLTAIAGQQLGHGLARRIVALSEGTRRVAEGDALSPVADDGEGDEVGQLTRNFNRMVDRIRGSYTELEAKVEDRTRALTDIAAELEAARRRLDLVIAGTGVGIWDWNPQTGSVVFNERWAEIVGYTLDELRPISIQTWLDLAHPDDLKVSGERLEEVFAGHRQLYECDARMRHRDGHWVWVRDTGSVVERDAEGRVTRMVGTHQDITAEKAFVDHITAYRNQLEAILAATPDALMTVNADLRITRFNPAAEQLFGWPAVEIIGRPLTELMEEGMGGRHDALARTFFGGPPETRRQMAGWRTVQGRKKDGTLFPVLVTLSLMTLDGRPVAVAAAKDVTIIESQKSELKSLAEQLGEQLRLAQEANRAKTRFLAAMSHELRTPLNAIIGFSEMVAGDLDQRITPEKREEYAGDVAKAGKHLLALINDLLDLARIEENRLQLDIVPCRPAELVTDPLRMLGPGIKDKQITLAVDLPPDLPTIAADERAVHQILVNLLGNASKFTPPGGTVTLSAVRRGRMVEFAVSDTGRGIPADKIQHLAQPFIQVDEHWKGAASGLGLGLALSRQLVERMGGAFRIESELGSWTRVSFTIPVAPARSPAPSPVPAST